MRIFKLSLCVFFASAACAMASERALDPIWASIGQRLGEMVAIALLALIGKILSWAQERRLIDEEIKMRLLKRSEEEAAVIVAYVEARAVAAGQKMRGEEKLREATRRLVERIPGLSGDRAAELVEAALVPLAQGAAKRIGA